MKCKYCKEEFVPNTKTQLLCSRKCKVAARKEQIKTLYKPKPKDKRVCKICKTEFMSSHPTKATCSKECSEQNRINKLQEENRKPKPSKFKPTVYSENTEDFEYTKMLKHMMRIKSGSEEHTKLVRLRAVQSLAEHIKTLRSSNRELDRLRGKQLMLEREYLRRLSKDNLEEEIFYATGKPMGGIYTLEEIGKIFSLSRERVRQIEHAAIKVMKSPIAGRYFKKYTEE